MRKSAGEKKVRAGERKLEPHNREGECCSKSCSSKATKKLVIGYFSGNFQKVNGMLRYWSAVESSFPIPFICLRKWVTKHGLLGRRKGKGRTGWAHGLRTEEPRGNLRQGSCFRLCFPHSLHESVIYTPVANLYGYLSIHRSIFWWAVWVVGLAISRTWQNRLCASARSEFSSKLVLSIIKKKEEESSSSRTNAIAQIPADSETTVAYFPCLEKERLASCLSKRWSLSLSALLPLHSCCRVLTLLLLECW